jgi:flagella basal body P-ring formation protein FlgA
MNRSKLALSFVALVLLTQAAAHGQEPRARTGVAVDPALAALIEASVIERLGAGASVQVTDIDLGATPADAAGPWVEAKPDPVARLGQPIRVTLVAEGGRSSRAVVTMRVTADYVVARRAIGRAQTVTAEDVDAVRGELAGTPLRPLPVLAEVVGGRALRPIDAEAPVLSGYVVAPRVVDPGDTITVVVRSGAVVVSATFTAADGGGVGDIIRVSNPDTRRFIKARIVERGLAEVVHER